MSNTDSNTVIIILINSNPKKKNQKKKKKKITKGQHGAGGGSMAQRNEGMAHRNVVPRHLGTNNVILEESFRSGYTALVAHKR